MNELSHVSLIIVVYDLKSEGALEIEFVTPSQNRLPPLHCNSSRSQGSHIVRKCIVGLPFYSDMGATKFKFLVFRS